MPVLLISVYRVNLPLNLTTTAPFYTYSLYDRLRIRITFIGLRCFEKSPENQRNTLKTAYRQSLADPRAPNRGARPLRVGDGRAGQTPGPRHSVAPPPGRQ